MLFGGEQNNLIFGCMKKSWTTMFQHTCLQKNKCKHTWFCFMLFPKKHCSEQTNETSCQTKQSWTNCFACFSKKQSKKQQPTNMIFFTACFPWKIFVQFLFNKKTSWGQTLSFAWDIRHVQKSFENFECHMLLKPHTHAWTHLWKHIIHVICDKIERAAQIRAPPGGVPIATHVFFLLLRANYGGYK